MSLCYCGSEKLFENCCKPYIEGIKFSNSPEELMRSRYVAYVIHNADYLVNTTHFSQRKHYSKKDILEWSKSNNWLKREVLKAEGEIVEFKAYFVDENLKAQIHHEKSTFKKEKDQWFYVDGEFY